MNDWTLYYPEKQIESEVTPLQFALDGKWTPEKIEINENLLADELCVLMEEEIEDKKDELEFDIIYDINKDPFRFTVDVNFDKYHIGYGVNPGDRIKINEIEIVVSWGKSIVDGVELSNSLPVKWNKGLLKSILETQIRLNLI